MKCFNIEELNKAIELIKQMQQGYVLVSSNRADPSQMTSAANRGEWYDDYGDEVNEGYGGETRASYGEYDELEQFICLRLIEEVLEEARAYAEAMREKRKAIHEPFPYHVLNNFEPSAKPRTATQTLRAFAALTDHTERRMIGAVRVNKWLQTHGYLDRVYIDEIEKEDWYPTELGNQVGIQASKTEARGQAYIRITYDLIGQMFLADHLEEIENEMLFMMQ